MLHQVENTYFPKETILNSPSRKDGVDVEIERNLRIYGCELIQNAGILLKLPQICMATSQVLLHRFYYVKSMKRYDVKHVAMASLFLAAKLEESPKRTREILNVFAHIEQVENNETPSPLDWRTEKYWKMKDSLIKTERHMLKEMGFIVYAEHPHKFLLNYLSLLELSTNTELCQTTWNYANDSLRTNLCVQYPPEVIATGCIHLAARASGIPMPSDLPWWEIFDSTLEEIDIVAYHINQLYKAPKASYLSLQPQQPIVIKEVTPPNSPTQKKSRQDGDKIPDKDSPPHKRARYESGHRDRESHHSRDSSSGYNRDRDGGRRDSSSHRDSRGSRDNYNNRDNQKRSSRDSHGSSRDSRDNRDRSSNSKNTSNTGRR